MNAHRISAPVLVLAVAVLAATPATAQNLDSIVELYQNSASSWETTLRNYAMGLFSLLVAIEVSFAFIMLALRGADMSEMMQELTKRLLFVGFFTFILMGSGEIARSIVESFRMAGNAAAQAGGGSGGVRPSDVFEVGMTVANKVLSVKQGWGLEQMAEGLGLFLCAILLIICFAILTALLILALVESYIVVSASVLILGFGGSRWTSDLAIKTLMYCVSVGAKLFVIQLLVGIAETMMKGWAEGFAITSMDEGYGDLVLMMGASLVMVFLTKTIPDTVQGIIAGASPSNGAGATMAAAGMALAAAVTGGAAALGAGSAVRGAGKLAAAQGAAAKAAGTASPSMVGRAAAFAGNMGKNLAGAATQDLGAKLGGRAPFGTAGGRMGDSMNQKAAEIRAGLGKGGGGSGGGAKSPAPDTGNGGGAGGGNSGGFGGGNGGGSTVTRSTTSQGFATGGAGATGGNGVGENGSAGGQGATGSPGAGASASSVRPDNSRFGLNRGPDEERTPEPEMATVGGSASAAAGASGGDGAGASSFGHGFADDYAEEGADDGSNTIAPASSAGGSQTQNPKTPEKPSKAQGQKSQWPEAPHKRGLQLGLRGRPSNPSLPKGRNNNNDD